MSTPARLLIALILLLLASGASYWAGDRQRNNAWLAKETRVEADALVLYQAEAERGHQAASDYLRDQHEQEARYAELDKKFKELRARTPLLVPPAAVRNAAAPAAGSEPRVDPSPQPQCLNVAVQPELSLAAVRLWNSALAGTDVPAGSCGSAAETGQACAAGSGLTTDDAWENHAVNAQSCASDRLRLERLIDYLEGRGK